MIDDTIDFDRLEQQRCAALAYLRGIERHASLASTNDRAIELAQASHLELPQLILADRQTGGRGRTGKRWWSGRRGLAFSLLLGCETLPREPVARAMTALAAAVAVVEAVGEAIAAAFAQSAEARHERPTTISTPEIADEGSAAHAAAEIAQGGLPLGIHWPNDVYFGPRKLAGVLVEALVDGRQVVGIGVNVNDTLAEAPVELRERLTTLREVLGRPLDRTSLLAAILSRFAERLELLRDDAAALGRAADLLCLQRHMDLRLHLGGRIVEGRCAGIAADGALLLDTATGREPFYTGTLHAPEEG